MVLQYSPFQKYMINFINAGALKWFRPSYVNRISIFVSIRGWNSWVILKTGGIRVSIIVIIIYAHWRDEEISCSLKDSLMSLVPINLQKVVLLNTSQLFRRYIVHWQSFMSAMTRRDMQWDCPNFCQCWKRVRRK